jgi:hypothetical protein
MSGAACLPLEIPTNAIRRILICREAGKVFLGCQVSILADFVFEHLAILSTHNFRNVLFSLCFSLLLSRHSRLHTLFVKLTMVYCIEQPAPLPTFNDPRDERRLHRELGRVSQTRSGTTKTSNCLPSENLVSSVATT